MYVLLIELDYVWLLLLKMLTLFYFPDVHVVPQDLKIKCLGWLNLVKKFCQIESAGKGNSVKAWDHNW